MLIIVSFLSALAQVKQWPLLFQRFGFAVQERPERVAQLPSTPSLNCGVLQVLTLPVFFVLLLASILNVCCFASSSPVHQSRIADLNTNVDRLLPVAPTETGAAWPTQLGGVPAAADSQQSAAAASKPATWAT